MSGSADHDLDDVYRHQGRTHEVRPRLVWLGLAGLLVGTAVAGGGVATGSWPVAVAGAVVLGLAALVAVRGGFFYDVAGGTSARDVVGDIRQDTVTEGPDPRDRAASPPVTRRVQAAEARRREAVEQRWTAPSPVRFAAVVLFLAGCWLVVAQGAVYADSPEGDVGGQRAVGVAIVVVVAATRILVAGHSRVASGFAWAAGAVLLLVAVTATHDPAWARWAEVATGVVVVLSASLTLTRPRLADE